MLKRFSILIIIRITLLVGNVLLIAWIFGDLRLFFNQIILSTILVGQIIELIHFVNHTNRELSRLFLAIRHSDFSISFKHTTLGNSFKDLQHSLNEIIQAYKQVKIEKEIQYQFLQLLVKQIQIGIISLEHDNIVLINPTAERLLNIAGLKNWKLFQQFNPFMANELAQLGDHGRKLIEVELHGVSKILAVDVSSIIILDKTHRLITLQDINSEIEQKEIEAWHKLIRILTHEIMNSITPVSSLTETMQSMLTDKDGNQKALQTISEETIADIRFSLNTIQKRNEGLLDFVDNYRKLTKIPKPIIQSINLKKFLSEIDVLMRSEFIKNNIQLTLSIRDENLSASFDPKLIEHVIINLLTNSMHALESTGNKNIQIKVYQQEPFIIIEVTDNGKGIHEKELKEIFIPFFSTKKEGSGIGLSLSKQIMSLHKGSMRVTSKFGEGASFYLQFNQD